MPAATAKATASGTKASALVWIEDGASRIARGEADSVTGEGLHATLGEPPAFGQGDEVAVRISLERGAPTLASTARVEWVRSSGGKVECQLAWTASANDRKQLLAQLARAA